jgi:hypothetical protein
MPDGDAHLAHVFDFNGRPLSLDIYADKGAVRYSVLGDSGPSGIILNYLGNRALEKNADFLKDAAECDFRRRNAAAPD